MPQKANTRKLEGTTAGEKKENTKKCVFDCVNGERPYR